MKRFAWILLTVFACGSPSSTPTTPTTTADPQAGAVERFERGLVPAVQVRGEDQHTTLVDRMRELKIHAVSIAVFENYELKWARAYGLADVETGQRADTRTTFLAGSISKSVNALGVLLAVADKTLGPLDAPINDQLTSWKLPDNELTRAKPVTLRMLLSHSGGATVHGFPGYVAGSRIPTIQQILDGEMPANTPAIRVDLAPATKFRYAGGGTTITQLALLERSKRPYQDVLADRVLQPLEMTSSSYEQALSPQRLEHAAVGYDNTGVVIPGKRNVYPEMAAAGLWTTPTDLARFFLEIARARAGKSSKIPKPIADQMTTKVIDTDGPDSVGLGVFLSERNGTRFFGHGGADAGFQADALASLDGGNGIVVMTNSEAGFRIFRDIERTVFAAYGWTGADPVLVRFALEPAERAKFVGNYIAGGAPLAVTDRDGTLAIHTPFEDAAELVPVAKDSAVRRDDGARFWIAANGDLETSPTDSAKRRPVPRLSGGKPHPLLELEAGRFDEAVAALRDQAKADAKLATEQENHNNNLGYGLLQRDMTKAILVLRLNTTAFPDSSNAHDSLGEAYMKAGDKPHAIEEYERAIATVDADPRIPKDRKATSRAHANEQLAKLRAP